MKKHSKNRIGRDPGLKLRKLVGHENREALCSVGNGELSEVLNWQNKLTHLGSYYNVLDTCFFKQFLK